jgi:hypothetical protein
LETPPLTMALEYVILLAELQPAKAKAAALRWHGRLELEAPTLTLAESQFALSALTALCEGDREAIGVLRRLLRKVRPTLMSRWGSRSGEGGRAQLLQSPEDERAPIAASAL